LLHQDEVCDNEGNLNNGDFESEDQNHQIEGTTSADKFVHGKAIGWKPSLRLHEEAAGLQKQEMDKKFEQVLLDRPRYW